MATFITTEAGELLLTEDDYFLIVDQLAAAIRKTFTVIPRTTEFTVIPRTIDFKVVK